MHKVITFRITPHGLPQKHRTQPNFPGETSPLVSACPRAERKNITLFQGFPFLLFLRNPHPPLSLLRDFLGFEVLTSSRWILDLSAVVKVVMDGESIATTSEGASTEADTATIEIKIKTLDSQTYTLRVNKCVPVPQLKEQIADVTGIESRQQRLICRGQVLRDSELLSHYHVEDGHTLHLVVRQPPESASNNPETVNTSSDSLNNQGNPVTESIVLEAINIQHRSRGFPNIGQIVSSIINSLGSSAGASLGTEAVAGAENSESRPSESAEPHLNPRSFTVEIGSMRVPSQPQSDAPTGSVNPSSIPDSLATISQYLEFMSEEFRRAGFFGSIDGFTPIGPGYGAQSVSNLSNALVSTRSLMTQAQICLSELAAQLSEHTAVTLAPAREQLQALSVRSGILMQNLGSLLLELGRNAIMLQTGPTPQDASVNAGPAMFISGNGPNPLMVQPVPFFPSSSLAGHTGDLYSSRGVHSDLSRPLFRPRNIDIHIRAGRGVSVPSGVNPSGETGTQTQEQPSAGRNSGSTNQGVNGEPGIRMVPVPLRMVAVPVLARIPMRGDSGGVVPPANEPSSGRSQSNLDHVMRGQNGATGSEPLIYASEAPSNTELGDMAAMLQEWLGAGHVVDPFQVRRSGTTRQEPVVNASPTAPPHASEDARIPEPSSGVTEEGVQFSNLLRQVLPVVSQIVDARSSASSAQNSVDGFNGHAQNNSNVSRNLDNPEEGPSAKRQRKND
ncbi:Ubiquitin-like superfamily protein [Rhynchospora pubera]|uniref:Ubiquitin-like superfamily protein n=1 Tax=Rhynchospora pubera TaxID=906938 RepID=A0AAV8D4H3_9POAL|nr:Ubiquitin-like superfamily protein [Rhynchospora pubera]